jgi:hypothetical protein
MCLGRQVRSARRSPEDDVSAVKNFGIFENISSEFRLEAFNVLNKMRFGFRKRHAARLLSAYFLPRLICHPTSLWR